MDCFHPSTLAFIAGLAALLLTQPATAQSVATHRAPVCDTLTADTGAPGERQAVLVDGLGTYSRPISTASERAYQHANVELLIRRF